MTSPLEALQNLVKIGKLKAEPPDQAEFDGLVRSAGRKLPDARNPGLSPDSRFILAYDAAHSLALAALRWTDIVPRTAISSSRPWGAQRHFRLPSGDSWITATRSATSLSMTAIMPKTSS